MDSNFSWLVVLAIGVGILIYFFNRKKRKQAEEERSSQIGTAAGHFAELVGKGIQIKLSAGEPANIALQNGEELLCVFPETILVEPRAVREWQSVYGGPSIRIAKGLSMRFGQSRGHSESHDERRAIDIGTLALTNERIVFVGSNRSSSVPLEKLINVDGFSDGLVVHRENKQKVEGYQLSAGKKMNYEYDGRTLTAPLDGRLIKTVIDFAIVVHRDAESRAVVAVSNGDRLFAQGNLGDALKLYRDSFAIRQKLVKADPGSADAQRALSVSGERIGNVLAKQGNLGEALKFYRYSLAVGEQLATAEPDNTDAQRDLSVWDDGIGDVLKNQGNLDEALNFYRNGLAIRKRLATADPANAGAQRDLIVSYANLGDVLKEQNNFGEALKSYCYGLASAERIANADPRKWQSELHYAVGKIGSLSYKMLSAHNFTQALDVADQAISAAPNMIWLYSNRAHALMFLGQVDEARAIYVRYRGHQKVQGENSWETIVLKDFAELRKAGMTHPLMNQIEMAFSAKQ